MKLAYNRLELNVENFAANEFIAACGDSGTNYLFECNAGPKKGGTVYQETNGKAGLQESSYFDIDELRFVRADQSLGGYHPCGETHKASTKDSFLDGYLVYNEGYKTKQMNVVIWRGNSGRNIHCTDQLDKNKWETAKS